MTLSHPHGPLAVLRHALEAGDTRLADLLAARLRARRPASGEAPSPAAARTIARLRERLLG